MIRNQNILYYDSISEINNHSQNHSLFDNVYNNRSDVSNIDVIDFVQIFNNAMTERNTDELSNMDNTIVDILFQIMPESNKLLGRKKKGSNDKNGGHNKFSFDNLMKKLKSLIIRELFIFINRILKIKYKNDIGKGLNKKQLKLINQAQIANGTIKFNQNFLNKTIGEIFSEDVSGRASSYLSSFNKTLIQELKDEKDPIKKEYFIGLFNTTFLECLKYFRGDEINNKYIEGLKKFNELENEKQFREAEDNNEEYIKCLKKFIKEYETILMQKHGRKSRKEKKEDQKA